MLKGLHPLLVADLLHALRAMGHGDEIALVDANFPAARLARRLIELPGATTAQVLQAVLSVLPLDTAVSPAVFTMEVIGDPTAVPPPVEEFTAALQPSQGPPRVLGKLERQAFYSRAAQSFAIVRTGELRRYGNILLVKGVINEAP
jgi:L-fucose mutarotase